MLTTQTKDLIKATTPLLKKHGEAIAAKMYTRLFEQYPQVKPLFASAPENQPEKVAKAIMAYCEYIEDLSVLDNALDNIARRHVATGVTPDHYPMVGAALLQAMQEVLGESITEDVLAAWKEAYFFLADALIQREKEVVA